MKARIWGCVVAAGVLILAGSGLRAQAGSVGGSGVPAATPAQKPADSQAAPATQEPPAMPGWMMPAPHENAPLGKFERFPGDGEGAYKTGHYRDLFAEQGHTPAETRAKIEKAFQQLFHGDGQEERVYFETGANENGTLAYVTDWANNDARTEGMSYGMMICVELG